MIAVLRERKMTCFFHGFLFLCCPCTVSTPEAVHDISRSVHLASQRTDKPISKPSFIPVPKAPVASTLANSQIDSTLGGDHLNISEEVTSRAVISLQKIPVARPKDTSSKVASRAGSSQQRTPVARPKDTISKVASRAGSSQQRTHAAQSKDTSSKTASKAANSQQGTPIAQPRDAGSISVRTPLMESMPRAHDLLADQVRATSIIHLYFTNLIFHSPSYFNNIIVLSS